MTFLQAPVDVDLDTLIDRALERLADTFPGWVPREGHLEVAVIEELARMVQETAQVAADVPGRIFADYGRRMHRIEQNNGARATGTLQVTVLDDRGYNIPAGTVVSWSVTGDEQVFFVTDTTLTVQPGTTSGQVAITAEEPGADGNGLGPGDADLVDAFAFVDQVELTDETAGGVDPEPDEDYRDRLADELQLMAPRPILPDDFAVLARRTDGVRRAAALDGYDPSDETSDNPRTITLVPVDDDGQPVPSAVVDQLVDDMESRREVNFVVAVDVPTYTPVDVTFTIVVDSGQVATVVLDRAVAAVERWLSPAVWGGGDQSPPVWRLRDTVRYLEAAAVLSQVDGVAAVLDLTLDGGQDDVQLGGVAPLPAPTGDGGTSVSGSVVS